MLYTSFWSRFELTISVDRQGRLNAWAHWKVARSPHEHRGPMLIYVCWDLLSINR
jgi:hypothetical protein